MKKLFSFIGCCLLAACSSHQPGEISGSLSGVGSDTLIVHSFVMNLASTERPKLYTDTVPLVNGKFSLKYRFKICSNWRITFLQIQSGWKQTFGVYGSNSSRFITGKICND